MITSFHRMKTPPLWAKCLLGSLALHSAVLYVLVQNPILFKKSWASFFSPSKPLPKYISVDADWNPDTLVLQHFFEEFPAPPKRTGISPSFAASLQSIPQEEAGETITVNLPSSFFLKEYPFAKNVSEIKSPAFLELEDNAIALIQPAFSAPLLSKIAYAQPVLHSPSSKDQMLNIPLQVHFVPETSSPLPLQEFVDRSSQAPTSKAALHEKQTASPVNVHATFFEKPREPFAKLLPPPAFDHLKAESPQSIFTSASLSEINDYLSEDLISALQWNDDFDVKSTLFPEQGGYVFSLAVTPKQDFHRQKIKQNFYFLIDTSSDVENHKLSVFKKSVLKALTSLKQGDSFNIFFLDKKITPLSASNLYMSPKNLLLAEEFLEKKGERALFSSLNLNQSLNDLLKYIESDEEVNTAILLSNGKATINPKDIRHFLSKNQGKLNLFTAAVGQNNQLTFLDMISSFCGGSLFYSDTNASFPRKLALFVKSLEAPLAKNLTLSLQASNPKASLDVSYSSGQMPNLYNQEPFIIMGKMDRLCDLHLVLQGKSAEDQIFLKKVIHFEEAVAPENSVKKQWLVHQKIGLYEKFLKEAKPIYLKNAKEILKTVHGKAFGE